MSGDRYSIDKNANPGETNLFTWALKDNGISLAPDYLYTALYTDYLQWKTSTFSTKAFTKYIRLTLPPLLSLRWAKRYFIGGVQVILDKINYEHPFTGIVKVDGFTYWDQSPD